MSARPQEIKAGKIEFRVDRTPISMFRLARPLSKEQIYENAFSVIETVIKARPSACKGIYLKSCAMCSTMGPGFRLDPAGLTALFR